MARNTPHERPRQSDLPLLGAPAAYARWWSNFWRVWWMRTAGLPAVEAARQDRFAALVRFARQHSPFYREAYRRLPSDISAPDALPAPMPRSASSPSRPFMANNMRKLPLYCSTVSAALR